MEAKAELTVPCTGPEVKGSAAWITPQTAKWSVSLFAGEPVRVHVYIEGTGRDGYWARGGAGYDLPASRWLPAPPDWLPVPHEWIEAATALVMTPRSPVVEPAGGEQ